MEAFSSLRVWLYRFRQKYSKKPEAKAYPLVPGLPDGLDFPMLETACQSWRNEKIRSVSHIHLSGWKSTGAFRLVIKTVSGRETTLIYKNAVYGLDEIPALQDFPIQPGLPEYTIYSQPVGALADLLPQVFLAEEIQPGKQYRYLLEDLRPGFHMMKSDTDKVTASRLLPQLHSALQDWAARADTSGLLRYNKQFSLDLQAYVRRNLELYSQRGQNQLLKSVLDRWEDITRVHLNPEFYARPDVLIHGDTNFSNVHASKTGPQKFKVVDWEWAGFGQPFADLASLLKGTSTDVERNGFAKFNQAMTSRIPHQQPSANSKENWRMFLWCSMERGMIDAAFLSAQHLNALHMARLNMPDAIANSLNRVMNAYRNLSIN